MRLTFLLLTIAFMNVQASGLAQNVTLHGRSLTLKEIFTAVKAQTGYVFLYSEKLIQSAQPVTVSAEAMPLEQFLGNVFGAQPTLRYKIRGKSIFISKKESMPYFDSAAMAAIFEPPATPVKIFVADSAGNPLSGASVSIKKSKTTGITNAQGIFEVNAKEGDVVLVSYIGYEPRSITITAAMLSSASNVTISLLPSVTKLEGVAIASNGYQDIPKERSTGSFEVITAKMLQHSSSPNLLQRLEGITSSIVFNNTQSPTNSGARASVSVPGRQSSVTGNDYNGGYSINNMTIRGKNSLANTSAAAPLVVIDGIANAYDISLINPDDVESITILKDAASASIWGSRAANGVLVIKTKRGKLNQPLSVSFNTNLSVSEKFDLFYLRKMSVSDYIDVEIYRFNQQRLVLPTPDPNAEGNPTMYSPVVEILDAVNKGTITADEGNAQINALRRNDIRKDQEKYLLRNQVAQNYSLNLSGGTSKLAYTLNGGYSTTQNNTVRSGSNRVTAAYNMQLSVVKNLSINAGVNYSAGTTNGLGTLFLTPPAGDATQYAPSFMPYTKLADDAGNPLAVNLHRPGFLAALSKKYGNKILDNSYYPLKDINESYNKTKSQNLGLTVDMRYRLNAMFSASLSYNYNLAAATAEQFYSVNSYYMRNLINLYTDPVALTRRIPLGGLLMPQRRTSHNQTIRGLVNFNRVWQEKHEVNAIIGLDVAENYGLAQPMTGYYGYDPKTLKTSNNVIYNTNYSLLYTNVQTGTTASIPNGPSGQFLETRVRTVGQFFNAAYTYDSRYTVTGSVRKDGNSTFGNKTNRTGTPFYHLGASWNIVNESFYHVAWLPSLKLRYTFGYNGNTNPGPTAEPLISLFQNSFRTLLPFASVSTLSNPELRPERTGIHNLGLDFGFTGGRITGSIEYYLKKTTDLLSTGPLDPTLGFSSAIYNVADLKGDGIDVGLNSTNLKLGKFSWGSNFHMSYNRVKVTKNNVPTSAYAQQVINGGVYIEGSNLTTLYAYQWAGLNPANGEARVYINGTPNNSQSSAAVNARISNLKEIGSAVPVYYGNLGNTFQYGGFGLYANILYKLGYYQRRPLNDLFINSSMAGAEYANRWQKPGDELKTNVPSLDYARSIAIPTNDIIYQYADINTYRADNIRLQEINLSYSSPKKLGIFKDARFYVNMPLNIILWRANKFGLDPDIYDFPIPRTYTFGFSTRF